MKKKGVGVGAGNYILVLSRKKKKKQAVVDMAEAQGSSSSVEDDNAAAMDGIYNNGRLSFRDNGGVMLPGSFSKAADLKPKRRSVGRSTCPDGDDIINLLHGSDPIKVELNRLENEVRGKP